MSFFYNAMLEKLNKMNFFIKETAISDMENAADVAVIASRIYLVLLSTSIVVLVLFTGLIESTTSVTVQSPSLEIYDKLQAQYSQLLSCPCEKIAIPYKNFVSIDISYHQVSWLALGQQTHTMNTFLFHLEH